MKDIKQCISNEKPNLWFICKNTDWYNSSHKCNCVCTLQSNHSDTICFPLTVIFILICTIYRQDCCELSKIFLLWLNLQKTGQIKGNKTFHFKYELVMTLNKWILLYLLILIKMSLYLKRFLIPYHGVFFLFLAVLRECSTSTPKGNIFLLHYPFDLFIRLKMLGKKSMLLKQYENMISGH